MYVSRVLRYLYNWLSVGFTNGVMIICLTNSPFNLLSEIVSALRMIGDGSNMATNVFGRGEGAPSILLRDADDDVDFGEKQQHQGYCSTQKYANGHGQYHWLAAKIIGEKPQPDDACCIHGETYKFRLVEIFWQVSGLHSVKCAHKY